ncbi:MAG: helix-turn-helix domain-containing protein, partial [Thermoleophilia bacterium]
MDDGDLKLRLRTLGETLRATRIERGLSLGDVAEGTDLSTSFLSLVENGRSDISTGRLFRVARFLGVGLGELLDAFPADEVTVARASDRGPGLPLGDGGRAFPLAGDTDDLTMAPVLCEYEPGAVVAGGSRSDAVQHVVFVVSGEIEITQRGEDPLLLSRGDSAYFRSEHECVLRNPSLDAPASILWVSSPPAPGRARPP